jgi:hypothetical protein
MSGVLIPFLMPVYPGAFPTFRTGAADRTHVAYMPDTTWPVSGPPPGSSRVFLLRLGRRIADCQPFEETIEPLSIEATEPIWQRILARQDQWCTLSEHDPDQTDAPTPHSPTTRHAPSPCSIEGADMTR